uniref:Uncharacterized protein n=1 Tax=Siphoviridae sp. ctZiV25 TaxID=2825560 RepID=A0A8S5TXS7_9CAUD|nr:MAG TPA: hypothetical protein [Siphoviridae sp. ctZiV25]
MLIEVSILIKVKTKREVSLPPFLFSKHLPLTYHTYNTYYTYITYNTYSTHSSLTQSSRMLR